VSVSSVLSPPKNGQIYPYLMYSQDTYDIAEMISVNSTIVAYVALLFAFLSLLSGKTIGL